MSGRRVWKIGWFLLISLSVGPVGAVTHNYEAIVISAFGPHSTVFNAGDSLVISYTLDPLVADTVSDPRRGVFQNAVLSLTISFPDLGIFAIAGPAERVMTFDNVVDQPSGKWSDQVFFFGGPISSASPLGGESIFFLEVDFLSGFLTPPVEPMLLLSDALPLFELSIIKDEAFLFLGTSSGFTSVNFAAVGIFADGFESGDFSMWSLSTSP